MDPLDWMTSLGLIALGVLYIARRDRFAEQTRRGTALRITPRGFAILGGVVAFLGFLSLIARLFGV